MNDENRLYWLWLAERCGIASKEFGRLVTRHPDPFELYRMNEDELEHLEGISALLKLRLGDKKLEMAYRILQYCKSHHVQIVAYGDPAYPERLRCLEDPPVLLYVLGRLPNLDRRLCVGIVGTRKMSEYGKNAAYTISYELAATHAVVVSGVAKGVDGVAACGALAAGGDTVAVLGCGISIVYPREHTALMRVIARNGAIVTEYPPAEPPNGWNFPKRNRLISGLCQCVLVVEGPEGSGALITAERAITQGKELFAFPGQVGQDNSEGPNRLIQRGARMATCAEDILQRYRFLYGDVLNEEKRVRALRNPVPAKNAFARFGVAFLYDEKKAPETKKRTEQKPSASFSFDSAEAENKERRSVPSKPSVPDSKQPRASVSEERLAALDETSRKVYLALPEGELFSADSVVNDTISTAEVLTSLTMLELCGLISAQPGGLYRKRSE